GSFSPAVYDTAWISMVAKEGPDGKRRYLFPKAFSYLLETQLPNGSWPAYSATIDGVLNTLAALLALKVRSNDDSFTRLELQERCQRAETAVRIMLKSWDIGSTDRVGFEVLVPGLLRFLEQKNIHFQFDGRAQLMKLSKSKTAIAQHMVRAEKQTTILHSLEAFVGILNFDDARHHKLPNGSMLNSPASTAAYLMHSSEWDSEAEGYLRMVLDQYAAKGHKGGVPSAFPSPVFETSWIIVTLLKSGSTSQDLGATELDVLADYLGVLLQKEGGKVGFAPSCLADADDTANVLSALCILGREVDIDPMLSAFEKPAHFITYEGERNASFSANCNVLLCLLESPKRHQYASQIVKSARFLDSLWKQGKLQDKWNTSSCYSMMLLAKAFVGVLREFGDKDVDVGTDMKELVKERLPAILLNVFIDLIERQNPDGSWDSKHEVSAYAVLALAPLLAMLWPAALRNAGNACFEKGKSYILRNMQHWEQGDYLWIEKVAYSLPTLSQAYCLAAAKVSFAESEVLPIRTLEPDKRLAKFFSRIEPFSKGPSWKLEACVAQSLYSVNALRRSKLRVFPEMEKTSNHEYLQFIPFTWIGCNSFYDCGVTPEVLWEMMLISMLNFQVDAYMETVIGIDLVENLAGVRGVIDGLCRTKSDSVEQSGGPGSFPAAADVNFTPPSSEPSTTSLREVEIVLSAYTTHILQHAFVLRSPAYLQSWLRRTLNQFLHAHVTHIEDCVGFPETTYHNWVHTTSADHTSCPFSFVFYLCLMHGGRAVRGKQCDDLFSGARTKYLLEDACRHLATICRQYNDYGSVARDQKEENLNSINFPEFQDASAQGEGTTPKDSSEDSQAEAKGCLLKIAEYERTCLNLALDSLKTKVDGSAMRELELFFEVTDLYGRIY
ncbi:Ent-kaurene synthase, partial [Setomelanomma holmii]